ncbi:hypothetical protein VTJ83DRAFT_6412 [Remersonia thermophila]|uniref:Galactose oxidase n=1 Tax=Remersonia thermophila TaxID=72144 RepID=A0ABR4D4M0_9PEZI
MRWSLTLSAAALQGALLINAIPGRKDAHWKELAPIPLFPRQEHTAVPLNATHLAILGGIIPGSSPSNPFPTTPLIQLYSISTNAWVSLPDLPVPLNHPNAAAVDGKIYLLGGLSDEVGDGVWRGDGRSFVFDFASFAWSELPAMDEANGDVPRGSAAVGVDSDTGIVYLAGGMTKLPLVEGQGHQESVDHVSAFDTRQGRWVTREQFARGRDEAEVAKIRTMPGKRDHAAAAVVDGVLYVLGGRVDGQENVRGEVFALDLKGLLEGTGGKGKGKGKGKDEDVQGWVTKRARMPTPRGGVCGAAVGGKVYVFGGEGNAEEGSEGVFDQVEAYDTRRDRWESAGRMRVPRHGTAAAAVGRGIYIPGGGVKLGGAPVDTFDVFYP